MLDLIIKQFSNPDRVITFNNGRFEVLEIKGMILGKATYKPGWRWSKDANPLAGTKFCEVEHLGIVLSGSATVAFENETEYSILRPGDLFYVPPKPHDSWVLGKDIYVSLHFIGADKYIKGENLE